MRKVCRSDVGSIKEVEGWTVFTTEEAAGESLKAGEDQCPSGLRM